MAMVDLKEAMRDRGGMESADPYSGQGSDLAEWLTTMTIQSDVSVRTDKEPLAQKAINLYG